MKTFDTTPTREHVNHMKYCLISIMIAIKGERENPKCCEEKLESCVHWWSCKMEQPQWRTNWCFLVVNSYSVTQNTHCQVYFSSFPFFCCDKIVWSETSQGRKGLIWLPGHGLSLGWSQGRNINMKQEQGLWRNPVDWLTLRFLHMECVPVRISMQPEPPAWGWCYLQ